MTNGEFLLNILCDLTEYYDDLGMDEVAEVMADLYQVAGSAVFAPNESHADDQYRK